MQCPPPIGKCKLFRIKHITLLHGEIFLRNKHEIAVFEKKCTFFGRKENTISKRNFLIYCNKFLKIMALNYKIVKLMKF